MDPFLGPWTITDWNKGPVVSDGIPGNGFKIDGPLTITQPNSTVNSVDLQWKNDNDHDCSVSGLQYDQTTNQLAGLNLTVSFAGKPVPCDLQVELVANTSENTLTLTINRAGESSLPNNSNSKTRPDVGSGVVTAISNG